MYWFDPLACVLDALENGSVTKVKLKIRLVEPICFERTQRNSCKV
jgi:hypothetical protein